MIKGLHHQVAKIYGFDNLSLRQRLAGMPLYIFNQKSKKCVNQQIFVDYYIFFHFSELALTLGLQRDTPKGRYILTRIRSEYRIVHSLLFYLPSGLFLEVWTFVWSIINPIWTLLNLRIDSKSIITLLSPGRVWLPWDIESIFDPKILSTKFLASVIRAGNFRMWYL